MGQQRVDVRVQSTASPTAVYQALRDGTTWPRWTTIGSFELERPGDGEPEGVGAIRVWRTGRRELREEIVELVPDRRFSYTLLSGLAVRGYRADVDLDPTPEGCSIHWHSTFRPAVPGTGGMYRRALARATDDFATGLATFALRHRAPS